MTHLTKKIPKMAVRYVKDITISLRDNCKNWVWNSNKKTSNSIWAHVRFFFAKMFSFSFSKFSCAFFEHAKLQIYNKTKLHFSSNPKALFIIRVKTRKVSCGSPRPLVYNIFYRWLIIFWKINMIKISLPVPETVLHCTNFDQPVHLTTLQKIYT